MAKTHIPRPGGEGREKRGGGGMKKEKGKGEGPRGEGEVWGNRQPSVFANVKPELWRHVHVGHLRQELHIKGKVRKVNGERKKYKLGRRNNEKIMKT